MIKSVVEKDTKTIWTLEEKLSGKYSHLYVSSIKECWDDSGAEVSVYVSTEPDATSSLFVRIPMTSVQRIIYEVGE